MNELIRKYRTLLLGGTLSAAAVAAIACGGGGQDSETVATSESTQASIVTTELPADQAPVAIVNGDTEPTTPIGDIAPAPAIESITPDQIVAAQEQVLIGVFDRVVNSVVQIATVTRQGSGEGSGWVWDTQGHLVTNYHVVEGATSILVRFFDGAEFDAEVIGFDRDADLAVIKIDAAPEALQPVDLGNSSELQVGQMAIALGNPFGQDFTMTTGIVSALGRLIESGFSTFSIPSVIQTDAAINPGNSGGPLLDRLGRVIGINTQIRSDSRQSAGVGFAVPVDLAKRVVPSLIRDGSHEYSFLGIQGIGLNKAVRDQADLPDGLRGTVVTTVTEGGPASTAGLQHDSGVRDSSGRLIRGRENFDGDVIVAVDGQPVSSMEDLIAYLALNTSPGDEVVLEVSRDGEIVPIVVTLGSRDDN